MICDFHIPYDAICFPLKIFPKHYFQLLSGLTIVTWEIENKAYAKLCEESKLHYGERESHR